MKRVKLVPKRKKVTPASPYQTVYLRRWHSVNGVNYGPGGVKVARDLGDLLMEQERNADWEDRQAIDPEPPGRVITGHNRMVLVRPGSFDKAMEDVISMETGRM